MDCLKLIIVAVAFTVTLAGCASIDAAKFSNGMLTDRAGMTLYTFDKDVAGSGKSACNGPCATNWPPLAANSDDKPGGDWSIVTRNDGSRQWAYKGKPVHRWNKDQQPGDKTGDGFNNAWHIVKQEAPYFRDTSSGY
jgi:predicted lipoprotein with Yx(FWY)xxD motif